MSATHTADGRRRSSMTHANRGHQCGFCDFVAFGNGGEVSHGRKHVRRGEAVELLKTYGFAGGSHRVFLAPDDEKVVRFIGKGYVRQVSS